MIEHPEPYKWQTRIRSIFSIAMGAITALFPVSVAWSLDRNLSLIAILAVYVGSAVLLSFAWRRFFARAEELRKRIPIPMSSTIDVWLTLTRDTPHSMDFRDTYSGLEDIWYKIDVDSTGNVTLWGNADGFEHLARYFLKMARTDKNPGYHAHHSLEFGEEDKGGRELTIGFANRPNTQCV